jgi:hypothetical protein
VFRKKPNVLDRALAFYTDAQRLAGQVGKYISVQASHRTVREPLDSHGS